MVFLIRRIIFGAILVFVSNSFFQIYSLFFVCLGQIGYLIIVRPFDDSTINRLEIFNEVIILVCCYHLLFYTDANISIPMKYLAGWSLDLLIILQFFFNLLV